MRRPFIVAEVGGNHLGLRERAHGLVLAAAEAGADAVKFQCFTPEQMADAETVANDGPWAGRKLLDLYRETHTPREWFPDLFKDARQRGLVPFASVFHPDDVDFLETLDCPIYKISSFEITDLPLLAYTAQKKKPMVLSMGMASWYEIDSAVSTAYLGGCEDVTLLKCTSSYPADASDANLMTMQDMTEALGWIAGKCRWNVGLSDHSQGIGVAVAAAALGAALIEKHLILSRSDGGPDASFSMEPAEFAQMVMECRRAAVAMGTVRYGPTESEKSSLQFRRKPGGKRG